MPQRPEWTRSLFSGDGGYIYEAWFIFVCFCFVLKHWISLKHWQFDSNLTAEYKNNEKTVSE